MLEIANILQTIRRSAPRQELEDGRTLANIIEQYLRMFNYAYCCTNFSNDNKGTG